MYKHSRIAKNTQIMRLSFLITLLLIVGFHSVAEAQFRDGVTPEPQEYTGTVTALPAGDEIFGLFDFRMDHSYEMTMGSFGGDTYNQNYYTNTMHFLFNENLTGRLDLAVGHSPFGNSFMGENQGPQFFVRNAQLNYNFSENTRLSVSFRQIPGGMYNPYGYGSNFYNQQRSPFSNRGSMFEY